jgi:hypothetical protein
MWRIKMIKLILFMVILTLSPLRVHSEQIFEVKDDLDNGVSSRIYFENVSNHIGDTDQTGTFVYEENCKANVMVIAKPKSPLYESGKRLCSSASNKLLVKVTWKPVYTNLSKNRELFIERGEFGAAALASNEIAARSIDITSANDEGILTIELFAKHLKLPETAMAVSYDPLQNKKVATPEMVEAIKTFQTNHGLPASGLIDYKTLSTAADREVGTIMFQQVQ